MDEGFIERHLAYTWETEPPRIFHRWSAIGTLAALLGRKAFIPHGHFRVFPNLYLMLIGDAGTRKSTAIKLATKQAAASGYDKFAANKTRLEKFLLDLEGELSEEEAAAAITQQGKERRYDAVMAEQLWGRDDFSTAEPRECFIAPDEWNEFAPLGDHEFYTTLGGFWDWDNEKSPFTHRLKNSKSVSIFQPTINILGGNTPEGFTRAFPADMIGTGFLSRMLLIYGERSERRYAFPPIPDAEVTKKLQEEMAFIRSCHFGQMSIEESARMMLEEIYIGWEEINDVRFKSYSNRRFTQLLKLCIICAANYGRKSIADWNVLQANTYLCAVEATMPRALGEFGKSKNSDVVNRVMELLESASKAMTLQELWKHVQRDLEKITQLGEMLQSLAAAEKVQYVPNMGWLPRKVKKKQQEFVDYTILTEEEQRGL